jgi:predicted DNA-binding transcriptional regulator AlpA
VDSEENIMENIKPPSEEVSTKALLNPQYLCRVLGISRRTLRRWIESKFMPAPLRLGPDKQTLRWRPREIIEFLELAREMGMVKPPTESPAPEESTREAVGG